MLEKYTLEYAEEKTGIPKQTLIEIAEMIRDADGTCILWGMGVTQNTGGSDTSAAISNLLLATGNYRREGAGRSEEHTSELQSRVDLVCRLLLEETTF